MESKHRIKRQYTNRQDLFHHWVHSSELIYRNGTEYGLIGKGAYLYQGLVKYNSEIKPILLEYDEKFNNNLKVDNILAIINREKKRIYINKTQTYCYDLKRAIPKDYTIIVTSYICNDYTYLYDNEKFHELVVKSWFENYKNTFYSIYYNLKYRQFSNVFHFVSNIIDSEYNDTMFHGNYVLPTDEKLALLLQDKSTLDFADIKYYVNKNHLNRKPWLNFVIINKFTFRDLIKDKVFTKEEKLLYNQRLFYTYYCFQNGIPFNYIKDNWDRMPYTLSKQYNNNGVLTCIYKVYKNITFTSNEHYSTVQDLIKAYIVDKREKHISTVQENKIQSNKNYEEALNKLENYKDEIIENWRRSKSHHKIDISYRSYDYIGRNNYQWITRKISGGISYLKYIYFRLDDDKIYTSRYANIPLTEGIRLYKLFVSCKFSIKQRGYINFRKDNHKFGIYPLYFMRYSKERDDFEVTVGCHTMWVKDFEEFIHYYKLEEQFGLTN